MHISDGVLSAPVWGSGGAVSAGLAAALLAKTGAEQVPRIALCTSFFFVASLVHVPLGPTSVHLLLNGLIGIIMGPLAFLPILFGLALQAVLFQYGGLTTIGVNALVMGLPAYAAWWLFGLRRHVRVRHAAFIFGFVAGSAAVALAAVLLALTLTTAGEAFYATAVTALAAHVPVALTEGVVTGFAASFLMKVEPGILEGTHA